LYTVSIPSQKIAEITELLQAWIVRLSAHKQQIQSLLGKLFHVAQCVPPARKFLNRMLFTLRKCPQQGRVILDDDFRKDLKWFLKFMPATNGIFMLKQQSPTACVIVADSCISAGGAACPWVKQAYSFVYPKHISQGLQICHLECLNVLAAFRLWAPLLKGKSVELRSDSATAVAVLQEGRGRDQFLQAAAREIWLLAAINEIDILAVHVSGESLLSSADALSRQHLSQSFKTLAHKYCHSLHLDMVLAPSTVFSAPLDW
jgi:hypothetical protein